MGSGIGIERGWRYWLAMHMVFLPRDFGVLCKMRSIFITKTRGRKMRDPAMGRRGQDCAPVIASLPGCFEAMEGETSLSFEMDGVWPAT